MKHIHTAPVKTEMSIVSGVSSASKSWSDSTASSPRPAFSSASRTLLSPSVTKLATTLRMLLSQICMCVWARCVCVCVCVCAVLHAYALYVCISTYTHINADERTMYHPDTQPPTPTRTRTSVRTLGGLLRDLTVYTRTHTHTHCVHTHARKQIRGKSSHDNFKTMS